MGMALRSDVARAGRLSGTAKPVDLVHLSALTLGDRELERDVLATFLGQADIYLACLRAARDRKARQRAAHALKGAARGIGAWELAERAGEAEAKTFTDGTALEAEMRRVCDYIRSLV